MPNYKYLLLFFIAITVTTVTACDDDNDNDPDIPPAEFNTVTLSFQNQDLELSGEEIEASALVDENSNINRMVISAQNESSGQVAELCIEINSDSSVESTSYPVSSTAGNGNARIVYATLEGNNFIIYSSQSTGTLSIETLDMEDEVLSGNFSTELESTEDNATDAAEGAFNLSFRSSTAEEDVSDCSI